MFHLVDIMDIMKNIYRLFTVVFLLFPLLSSAQVFDVPLVSQTPTYDASRIPINPVGYDAFYNTQWISGGHFVSAGYCNNANVGNSTIPNDRRGQLEAAGQYVFNENGTLHSISNACHNTANITTLGCNEGQGCSIGFDIFATGDNSFIREGNPHFGNGRSPVSYKLLSNTTSLVGRNYFNNWVDSGTVFPEIGQMVKPLNGRSAIANNVYVVNASSYHGGHISTASSYLDTFFLSIPSMTEITRMGQLNQPYLYPEAGVGEYLVAREDPNTNVTVFRPVYAYRMPSASALASGALPENLGALDFTGRIEHVAKDVSREDQIVLYVRTSNFSNPNGSPLLITYRSTTSGLEEVARRASPFELSGGAVQKFSVSGDTFVWTACSTVPSDYAGSDPFKCNLVVEQGGAELSVEPLPLDSVGNFQTVRTFSVAPSGKILVTTKTLGRTNGNTTSTFITEDQENVYVYQAGGSTTPGSGNGGGQTPQTPTGLEPSYETYKSIIDSYINILQRMLGGLGVKQDAEEDIFTGLSRNPALEGDSTTADSENRKSIFDGIAGISDSLKRLFPAP